MFSTFVGLGRFINCQRPECTTILQIRKVLPNTFRPYSTKYISDRIFPNCFSEHSFKTAFYQ